MGFAFCSVCHNIDDRKDSCTNCGGKGFVTADTRGRSGFHGERGTGTHGPPPDKKRR